MNYENLKDFVKEVIEIKGGVAEEKEEGILEAILPENISKNLQCKEYEKFSFSPERRGNKFITYGSPLLDKVISLAQDMGKTARISLEQVYLKKKSPASLIEDKFNFLNMRKLGPIIDREVTCSYLLISFRAIIISDERREEILTTIVDEQTLRTPRELVNPILGMSSYTERGAEEIMEKYPLKKVYERIKEAVIKNLNESLKDVETSSLRRLKRDITRLWSYYQDLKKELKKRIMRKLSPEERPEEKEEFSSKIKAIDLEFKRKTQDLVDKYNLKVILEPINACRVYLPKIITEYEVQRKSFKKKLNFFWNPLMKEIEPLVCEACLEDTYNIYLCDKLHLVCPQCYFKCKGCGKRICKKCFPEKCPTCGSENGDGSIS